MIWALLIFVYICLVPPLNTQSFWLQNSVPYICSLHISSCVPISTDVSISNYISAKIRIKAARPELHTSIDLIKRWTSYDNIKIHTGKNVNDMFIMHIAMAAAWVNNLDYMYCIPTYDILDGSNCIFQQTCRKKSRVNYKQLSNNRPQHH